MANSNFLITTLLDEPFKGSGSSESTTVVVNKNSGNFLTTSVSQNQNSGSENQVDLLNVLGVEILSFFQRIDNRHAEFSIRVIDFDETSVTINSVEYSTDGVVYNTATPQTLDVVHTFTSPIDMTTGGTVQNFKFVWDAKTDLGVGTHSGLYFRIDIQEGARNPIDIFTPFSLTFDSIIEYPKEVVISSTICSQTDLGSVGKSDITLNFAAPTSKQVSVEAGIVADSNSQSVFSRYTPPIASVSVREVTDQSPSGGASTSLSSNVDQGQDILQVNNATGFSVGDYIRVKNQSDSLRKYYEIISVDSGNNLITINQRVSESNGLTSADEVVEVTTVLKTLTTDYTLDLPNGIINLVSGQFTSGNDVIIKYESTNDAIDHFELYKVPGDLPTSTPTGYTNPRFSDVIGTIGVSTVDNNISNVSTLISDNSISDLDNGEQFTYYMFVENSVEDSLAIPISTDFIPSIPQNIIIQIVDEELLISWDALPVGSDDFTDGFNIFRCPLLVYNASQAIKINSSLIPKATTQFTDGASNVTNRVSEGVAPFPINGNFSYKVESEITNSSWTDGTANETSTQAQDNIASK